MKTSLNINKLFIAFFCLSYIIGCNTSSSDKEQASTTGTNVEKQDKGEDALVTDQDTVYLNVINGYAKQEIEKKKNQTIFVGFTNNGYKKIDADLSSNDSTANIRFSQIFLPDGEMDGPFGIDMTYPLSTNGKYKLSIHENLMADDPWGGIFTVEIKLSK